MCVRGEKPIKKCIKLFPVVLLGLCKYELLRYLFFPNFPQRACIPGDERKLQK